MYSGDGGLCIGAVALRIGLPNGDRDLSMGVRGPSWGVTGDMLRDGGKLTGVSCWPCGRKGRSVEQLISCVHLQEQSERTRSGNINHRRHGPSWLEIAWAIGRILLVGRVIQVSISIIWRGRR
jgi:hypothetical protein